MKLYTIVTYKKRKKLMDSTLVYIVVTLAISVVINIILKKIGISQIIGYILTGTLVSYFFHLKGYADSKELQLAGEFGIVFLMFTVGLEISINKMRAMKRLIFTNGILQLTLTSIVFFCAAHYFFHLDTVGSIIVALAFSLSSTAVVLSHLKSSKEIYTPYGQHTTGILVFQDIAVIPILILIGFLQNEGSGNISTVLYHTFGSAVIVLGVLFIFGKTIMTELLKFSVLSEIEELFIGTVLVIVMGASLLAHYMGFTYSLGAFIVGMLISETRYYRKIESDIAPFKDLLLGTFFVIVGMKMDIGILTEYFPLIMELLVVTFIVKAIIIYLIVRQDRATSLKAALAISQVGEFSFVIFALASSNAIISFHLAQILSLVVIISMILTPFIVANIDRIASFFIVNDNSIPTDIKDIGVKHNHIIVCGYSLIGKYVVKELERLNIDFVIVDNNIKHVQRGFADGREIYLGDMSKSHIIEALHIQNAAGVIVTLENVDKTYLVCEAVLSYVRNVNLIVKVISASDREKLRELAVTAMIDGKIEVANKLVQKAISCQLEKEGS
jgi:monovalent cation:H+ antiporter-2, CPA2 family